MYKLGQVKMKTQFGCSIRRGRIYSILKMGPAKISPKEAGGVTLFTKYSTNVHLHPFPQEACTQVEDPVTTSEKIADQKICPMTLLTASFN